jgi:DNA-binding response OmpR family regulator
MSKSAVPTRLLVVDADDAARTFLRRRFTRLGYEVLEAAGHRAALAMVAAMPFDLILLDLQTPGADGESGLELLRQMRERRAVPAAPILAIAPASASQEAVEALALGADDCLFRPLYAEVVQARAEKLLRRRNEASAGPTDRSELQARLETLEEAAVRTEAVAAGLGRDQVVGAPINSLLGAAAVLTQVCETPELTGEIDRIERAASSLDLMLVRALGRADRRARAPKSKLRVLLADDDSGSRLCLHDLLAATKVEVELVEVPTGHEARQATDAMFFDLIMVNLGIPEAIDGIEAIRRAEHENKTRRTPILAIEAQGRSAGQALRAGADLYVRRMVTAERVLSALADALAREADDIGAVT